MANALWIDPASVRSQGDNLDDFGRHVGDVFGTEMLRRHGQGGSVVNDWSSEVTCEEINFLTADQEDEQAPGAPLLLTTVAAVKAKWSSAFDPFHTWPGEFSNEHGEGALCHMMFQKGTFQVLPRRWDGGFTHMCINQQCAYLQDFSAVRLPCGITGDITVTLVLPNFTKIDDAVKQFTPERWQALCKSFVSEEIKLYVPRFRVETTTTFLKNDLEGLGVTDIFSSTNSNMSRLGETGNFWLEDIVHKAAFTMNEEGAKPIAGVEDGHYELSCAAPVTGVRVDRPFLFVVHRDDLIILLGKIVAPMSFNGDSN